MTRSIRCPNCGYANETANVGVEHTCFCGCKYIVLQRSTASPSEVNLQEQWAKFQRWAEAHKYDAMDKQIAESKAYFEKWAEEQRVKLQTRQSCFESIGYCDEIKDFVPETRSREWAGTCYAWTPDESQAGKPSSEQDIRCEHCKHFQKKEAKQ